MRRVLSVHFAPCALFVAGVLALVRAGSFSGRSNWHAVWPQRSAAALGLVMTVVLGAALLGSLAQPFQVRAVRVLEGYWDRWFLTAWLAGALAGVQRRRWQALRRRAHGKAGGNADLRVRADARRRLAGHPPAEVLLPTALGNALRAGELSAGERYGLTTLTSWPRIFFQVSDRMSEVLRSTRDALDTAVNLCWAFLTLVCVGAGALYDEPSLWWWCGTCSVLAALAYKGAVTAAQAYSGLMHVVYDLHRFDLLEALHYPLPTREDEPIVFAGVSAVLEGRKRSWLRYVHEADGGDDGLHGDGEPG